MPLQSTYLLPNAGGFSTFVDSMGGESATPPMHSQSVSPQASVPSSFDLGSSPLRQDSVSSSIASEYFSPTSVTSAVFPLPADCTPPPDFEVEPEPSEEEKALTAPVQGLLDVMNEAMSRMNTCEEEIHAIEAQRQKIAHEWRDKKGHLLAVIGAHTIESAKPAFEAYEEQLQLQHLVNEATSLYKQTVAECDAMKAALHAAHADGSDDAKLAELLELMVAGQTKRDTYEHLSHDRMHEFQQAQAKCLLLKKTTGLRTMERAWPWFESFLQSKGLSEECSEKIAKLKREAASLRDQYRSTMSDLESISAKVHLLRKSQNN